MGDTAIIPYSGSARGDCQRRLVLCDASKGLVAEDTLQAAFILQRDAAVLPGIGTAGYSNRSDASHTSPFTTLHQRTSMMGRRCRQTGSFHPHVTHGCGDIVVEHCTHTTPW